MIGEVKLKIGGKELTWRDNMLTSATMVRLVGVKNQSQVFMRLHDEGPTEELVGAVVAAGIMYQPDEQGHFRDIGITPLDALAGMDRKDGSLQAIVMKLVGVMKSVDPTSAGKPNPAAEARATVKPLPEMPEQVPSNQQG